MLRRPLFKTSMNTAFQNESENSFIKKSISLRVNTLYIHKTHERTRDREKNFI